MFILAPSLVVAQEAAGGRDWANLDWPNLIAGLVGALATLIAAVITVHLQDRGQKKRNYNKIRSNSLSFKSIAEKDSFSALDVFKVIDLRGSPSLKADVEGTAVLTDSHLITREGDTGNGVVFCYATSGNISGTSDWNAYEWGEIDHHSPLKRGIPAKSCALGVHLDSLYRGQVARITNRIVYRGAFDDVETERFETHIDRSTPSLTFLFLFSSSYPCLSVVGEIDVGRDQWRRVEENRPVILNGGTLLYWRVFADDDNNSLRHLSKYQLRWTWRPSSHPESGEMNSAAIVVGRPKHEQ